MGPEESWPKFSVTDGRAPQAAEEEEMSGEFVLAMANAPLLFWQRFSSFNRQVRTTAWILRFIRRCRGQRYEREEHGLTSVERADAEHALVRLVQREAFAEEAQRGTVSKSSQLSGRSPYFHVVIVVVFVYVLV